MFKKNCLKLLSLFKRYVWIFPACSIIYGIYSFLNEDIKEMEFEIFSAGLSYVDDMQVIFDKTNKRAVEIIFKNTGDIPFKPNDFEKPIKFIFPEKSRLFLCKIPNSHGHDLEFSVEKNELIIPRFLLNSNQEKHGMFCISGNSNYEFVEYNIAGIDHLFDKQYRDKVGIYLQNKILGRHKRGYFDQSLLKIHPAFILAMLFIGVLLSVYFSLILLEKRNLTLKEKNRFAVTCLLTTCFVSLGLVYILILIYYV